MATKQSVRAKRRRARIAQADTAGRIDQAKPRRGWRLHRETASPSEMIANQAALGVANAAAALPMLVAARQK